MGHGAKQSFSLRDLDDKTNPFCILTMTQAVGGRLETVTRFDRLLVVASGSFDGPPVTRIGSEDSSRSPSAPPCYNRPGR
jgi:hypothetical protein